MKKQFIEYELASGETGQIRSLTIDKIRMEKTVRTNGWPLEDGPRTGALILYHALKRAGVISDLNFNDFIETELLDYGAANDPEEQGDEENPI